MFGPSAGLNLGATSDHVTYDHSEFEKSLLEGNVKTARWYENTITGELKEIGSNRKEKTYSAKVLAGPETDGGTALSEKMTLAGVDVKRAEPLVSPGLQQLLTWGVMFTLMFALFYFFIMRPAQQGGNQATMFGRSKAKRASETNIKITFDDVAGIDEAKQELFEVVDFLRNTKKYAALGAKIPKGILLTGPPGVGKTHLARAIAGEAGVPFFHISGSDFVEMFVGVGAARVRDLFETAKAHRPCLIFIDEIDAVGRQRGAGLGGGHDEREQTLNQLLVEMDGFDTNMGVIMIAATNRPDVLDPALLRPGRFDRQIVVDTPDAAGREKILQIHSKGKPFDPTVDLATVAKRTPGFTGADLANALNEAALLTARRNRTRISMDEIEESLDRVLVGPARKSRAFLPKEREVTAFHEAGHAIIGECVEGCDPVHKVTVLPRGQALGLTWSLPETDSIMTSRTELIADICMSLGGLVAEELVYGERWTGSSSDLKRVTRIARAMVTKLGMSDKLGTLVLGSHHENPFLGRDYGESRDYSEEVARMIDDEVRSIVDEQHRRATAILTEHRPQLDAIAAALLEHETLDRNELLALMRGEPMPERKLPPVEPGNGLPSGPDSLRDAPAVVAPPRLEPGTA